MKGSNKPSNSPVEISVVLPVFNEEENLAPLVREIEQALKGLGMPFEILCVDDHSTDGSLEVARALARERSSIRVLAHRVNCGQSAAYATGFREARGALIVTMDADGQNDPADIPSLLRELDPGTAAVCGIRRKRADRLVKRIASRIANRFRNAVTGDRIEDAGCTFRVLRRSALRELPVFNGMHRFLPTLLRLQGYGVKEIPVNHRPRTRGEAKYGIRDRLWRGLADCVAIRWYRRRCFPAERLQETGGKAS
jgi:glycosyltransferase involved in cell wall biosynthesis